MELRSVRFRSGQSKFANIKQKKERNDAAKGKIFTRIGREITVAVKESGPDPANNSKLKDIIAKAKANNMPNDNIDRSIKKAAGEGNNVDYVSVTYEGYGPKGLAIIVEALTDNKNRTASNVCNAFTKGGGSVGTQGCVSFMFDKKGQIIIDKEDFEMDFDELDTISNSINYHLISEFNSLIGSSSASIAKSPLNDILTSGFVSIEVSTAICGASCLTSSTGLT